LREYRRRRFQTSIDLPVGGAFVAKIRILVLKALKGILLGLEGAWSVEYPLPFIVH